MTLVLLVALMLEKYKILIPDWIQLLLWGVPFFVALRVGCRFPTILFWDFAIATTLLTFIPAFAPLIGAGFTAVALYHLVKPLIQKIKEIQGRYLMLFVALVCLVDACAVAYLYPRYPYGYLLKLCVPILDFYIDSTNPEWCGILGAGDFLILAFLDLYLKPNILVAPLSYIIGTIAFNFLPLEGLFPATLIYLPIYLSIFFISKLASLRKPHQLVVLPHDPNIKSLF